MARVVEFSTVIVVLLVGLVTGVLFRQNLRIRRQVLDRTLELRASTRAAEAANRSKTVFLANVSHEIRTPLNGIMGFTDILERGLTDADQRDHLHSIRSSGERLLSIVSDILDLSRLDAGSFELQPEPLHFPDLLERLLAPFRQRGVDKGITVDGDIAADVPDGLVLDGQRLSKVLGCLLDNAVKFTAKGSVRLSITAAVHGDRANLTLRVQDTGAGIPAAERQRIFDAFVQRDGQSINDYGGLGLGLALTRQLVESMHGQLTVESEPGRGSTFSVVLPGVPVAADIQEPQAVSASQEAVAEPQPPAATNAEPASPEMLDELRRQQPRWQALVATQTIDEVEAFGHELEEMGRRYGHAQLEVWGAELAGFAMRFDMHAMDQRLQTFPQLLEEPGQQPL